MTPAILLFLALGAAASSDDEPSTSGLAIEHPVESPRDDAASPDDAARDGDDARAPDDGASAPPAPAASADTVLGVDDITAVGGAPATGPPATGAVSTSAPAAGARDDAKPARAAIRRIAVYDFVVDGVDDRAGRLVTAATVTEVRKLAGVSVVGLDEIRAMLDHEASRQTMGCADDGCLSELADALDVDELVTGTLTRQGGEHVFGLRRIDHRAATVVGSVSLRFPAERGEEFLAAIGPAIAELFAELPLRPGARRGVDDDVLRRLNPPPLPLSVFVAGAVVEGALVATTSVAAAAFWLAQLDYDQYATRGTAETIQGSVLQEKARTLGGAAIAVNSALVVTLVHAAVLGVVAIFVDWRGDGASE